MSEIIPYFDDLGPKKGAFIRPDGKILFIKDNKHEEFAELYCNGRDYSILSGANFGPPISAGKYLEAMKDLKDAKDGVDIFRTSYLTKIQLERYKNWLKKHKTYVSYCDFLVLVLAFDKIETKVNRLITTTAAEPHVRFYNYYLMDWEIRKQNPLVYVPQDDSFVRIQNEMFVTDPADREAEEEINEIKAKVLYKDRPIFFKE